MLYVDNIIIRYENINIRFSGMIGQKLMAKLLSLKTINEKKFKN